MSESRPEWVMCDMAILALGAVTVPIYPTLSAAQARYILDDCGARLAIVSTRLQLEKVQDVRHLLPALEAVVVMDEEAAAKASVIGLDEVAATRPRADDRAVGRRRRSSATARARSGRRSSRPSSTRRGRPASRRA